MGIYNRNTPYLQPEAYYSVYLKQYSMSSQHTHSRCEIMYVLSGKSIVDVADQRYELSHGQYIFLDENVPHCLNIADPRGCSIMNIEFACRAASGAGCVRNALAASPSVQAFFQNARPYFVADGREIFGSIMKDLISQLDRIQTADTRFLIGNLLERMLCELAAAAGQDVQTGSLHYIRRASAYLETHYTESLSVEEIAAAAGINRSYLQALFRQEFGCGVMTYVNRMRISRAKFLLTNTEMRLVDIAAEVGFNSRQNFALAFEKQAGMSPSSFRKMTSSGFQVATGSFKRFNLETVKNSTENPSFVP
ncbi:MAG: AraC family transcriptional regulator [Candidatus Merdivicinus sp.]